MDILDILPITKSQSETLLYLFDQKDSRDTAYINGQVITENDRPLSVGGVRQRIRECKLHDVKG